MYKNGGLAMEDKEIEVDNMGFNGTEGVEENEN